ASTAATSWPRASPAKAAASLFAFPSAAPSARTRWPLRRRQERGSASCGRRGNLLEGFGKMACAAPASFYAHTTYAVCTPLRSKLTGPAFVQTLTFGWLSNPEATLEDLAQTASTVGVSISPQGLDQRFTPQAAACVLEVLQAAVARVLTADPVAIPILQRFPG